MGLIRCLCVCVCVCVYVYIYMLRGVVQLNGEVLYLKIGRGCCLGVILLYQWLNNWGKIFPKIGKWLTPTVKHIRVLLKLSWFSLWNIFFANIVSFITLKDAFRDKWTANNFVKESACFKSSSKPTTIDLFLSKSNTLFQNTKVMNMRDQHAPLKKKLWRANNAPYIAKQLRKAIMKRSQREKNYLKKLTDKSLKV